MKITFISVGKIKESFYTKQIEGNIKNIKKYAQVQVIEVPDEKCPEKLSDKEMIQVKDKEGERILSKINSGDFVIALAIEGKMISTDDLKSLIKMKQTSSIVFIIGGSLGLSEKVLKRSNYKLSFSRLTFPHQLMKVLLTEQVHMVVK